MYSSGSLSSTVNQVAEKANGAPKRAELVAPYKIVLFLICQYDENEGVLVLRGGGGTTAVRFVCKLEEGL